MFKQILKLSGLAFLSGLLIACSRTSEKKIDYNTARSMPGYGYILFDFSKSKEINYGRNFVPGKTDYIVFYVNGSNSLFIKVVNAEFDGRILKAYVPYVKGYRLFDVSRFFWYPFKECKNCKSDADMEAAVVYIVNSTSEARCEEATYRNYQKYENVKGCKDMDWVERYQALTGSVLITPNFHSGFNGMFTPYLKPGYNSAGS